MEKREESGQQAGVVLQKAVKQIHFGGSQEKEDAAIEIRRIARDQGRFARKLLSGLGVIPCLVSMLDSGVDRHRRLAVLALVELANDTYTNKAIMVEAGLLNKLNSLITPTTTKLDYQPITTDLLSLLLSISTIDKAHVHFTSPCNTLLPTLIQTLITTTADQVKHLCLATLSNLSTKLHNAKPLVSAGIVPTLLRFLQNPLVAQRALLALGNLVVTSVGKKEIEENSMVPKYFVEVMSWDEHPKCQELGGYVMIVLARGNWTQRRRMVEVGMVPMLVRVALLGSEVGKRRALKLLEWLRGEKEVRVNVRERDENGSDMKKMVRQSLDRNMASIVRRASGGNGDHGGSFVRCLDEPSRLKSLDL